MSVSTSTSPGPVGTTPAPDAPVQTDTNFEATQQTLDEEFDSLGDYLSFMFEESLNDSQDYRRKQLLSQYTSKVESQALQARMDRVARIDDRRSDYLQVLGKKTALPRSAAQLNPATIGAPADLGIKAQALAGTRV